MPAALLLLVLLADSIGFEANAANSNKAADLAILSLLYFAAEADASKYAEFRLPEAFKQRLTASNSNYFLT